MCFKKVLDAYYQPNADNIGCDELKEHFKASITLKEAGDQLAISTRVILFLATAITLAIPVFIIDTYAVILVKTWIVVLSSMVFYACGLTITYAKLREGLGRAVLQHRIKILEQWVAKAQSF